MGDSSFIPVERKQKQAPPLPANYVSLAVLRERWLLKQNQPQEEPKPKENHQNGFQIAKHREKGKKREEDSNEWGSKSQIDNVDDNKEGKTTYIVSQKKKWRNKGKPRAHKTPDTENEKQISVAVEKGIEDEKQIWVAVEKEIEDEKQIPKVIEDEKRITSEANGKKSGARNGNGFRRWVNKMEIGQKFEGLSINSEKRRDHGRFGGSKKRNESRMIWVAKSDGIHTNANANANANAAETRNKLKLGHIIKLVVTEKKKKKKKKKS